jgi:hypothetical protein
VSFYRRFDAIRHVWGALVDGEDSAAAGGNRVGGEPLESGERGPEVGQAELLAQLVGPDS